MRSLAAAALIVVVSGCSPEDATYQTDHFASTGENVFEEGEPVSSIHEIQVVDLQPGQPPVGIVIRDKDTQVELVRITGVPTPTEGLDLTVTLGSLVTTQTSWARVRLEPLDSSGLTWAYRGGAHEPIVSFVEVPLPEELVTALAYVAIEDRAVLGRVAYAMSGLPVPVTTPGPDPTPIPGPDPCPDPGCCYDSDFECTKSPDGFKFEIVLWRKCWKIWNWKFWQKKKYIKVCAGIWFKIDLDWSGCCLEHDREFFCGGDYVDFSVSNYRLGQCVENKIASALGKLGLVGGDILAKMVGALFQWIPQAAGMGHFNWAPGNACAQQTCVCGGSEPTYLCKTGSNGKPDPSRPDPTRVNYCTSSGPPKRSDFVHAACEE